MLLRKKNFLTNWNASSIRVRERFHRPQTSGRSHVGPGRPGGYEWQENISIDSQNPHPTTLIVHLPFVVFCTEMYSLSLSKIVHLFDRAKYRMAEFDISWIFLRLSLHDLLVIECEVALGDSFNHHLSISVPEMCCGDDISLRQHVDTLDNRSHLPSTPTPSIN